MRASSKTQHLFFDGKEGETLLEQLVYALHYNSIEDYIHAVRYKRWEVKQKLHDAIDALENE